MKVSFFIDNNFFMRGKYVEGVQVIAPKDIKEYSGIDAILISTSVIVDDVIKQLHDMDIKLPVYLVPDYVYEFKTGEQMPPVVLLDLAKPRLPWLECGIVEHCNLSCKGCTACANMREEVFLELSEFERDLKALQRLFSGIKYFKLFGGEPLLHPKLEEFIVMAREYFPDSKLVVHSNGLLVPELSKDVLNTMRRLDAYFRFTLYPVTGIKKRKIEETLDRAGVRYVFTEPVYEFHKLINVKGDYNAEEIFKQCAKCINIYHGVLSCGLGDTISFLEKQFNTNICDVKTGHRINIHTTELNGWEINKILATPSKLCSYCNLMTFATPQDEATFPWKCEGKPKLEDWVMLRINFAEKGD